MPQNYVERQSMEDRVCEDVAREVWSDDFSRSLAQLRRGADELLKDQRTKWQSAEAILLRQIVELRETIAREESRGETLKEELDLSRQRLVDETRILNEVLEQARARQETAIQSQARLEDERRAFMEEFGRLRGELEVARHEITVSQEELAQRREALVAETAKLEQRTQEISAKHIAVQVKSDEQRTVEQELEAEKKRLADLKNELDHATGVLDRERDLLQIRQRETAAQRRRLAREFRLQRMQLLAEVHESGNATHGQPENGVVVDDAQVRMLREEIAVRAKQQEALEQQLLEQREMLAASNAEEQQLRRQLEEVRNTANSASDDQNALAELRQQFENLQLALQHANTERKTLQTTLLSEREQITQAESRRKREQETLEHEVQQLREQLQRGVMDSENELVETRMAAAQAKVELERRDQQLTALRKQLDAKINEVAALQSQSAHGEATGDALIAMDEMRAERDALIAEIEQLKASGGGTGEDQQSEIEELRHRIDMAMADLRQANSQVADLKKQLAQKNAGGGNTSSEGGAGDWEHQKRLLLAQLEADEVTTPQQKKERLKIEDVIAKTNSVVAEKESEIAELKALLEMRPQGNAASVETAFGAAAISQLLDGDELVKQQRETLERMTKELQEKLRQCEIDTSLERAKLARERAELQELLQKLEDERAKSPDNPARSSDNIKSPGRRNWLDHLGLNKGQEGPK
jgi:chromosome segregation ATPase